jgi:hypothetical protein
MISYLNQCFLLLFCLYTRLRVNLLAIFFRNGYVDLIVLKWETCRRMASLNEDLCGLVAGSGEKCIYIIQ